MSKQIRRHPKLATLFGGLLVGAVLWAVAPPEAEAGPHKKIKDLISDLQESVDELAMQVEDIPTNWTLPEDGGRFELVFPETVNGATEYAGVLDRRTMLIWKRLPSPAKWVYTTAELRALQSQAGNVMGWRLPFADELLSLMQVSRTEGAFVVHQDFPVPAGESTISGEFWTQTAPNSETKAPGGSVLHSHQLRFVIQTGVEPINSIRIRNTKTPQNDAVYQAQVWCVMGPGGQHR